MLRPWSASYSMKKKEEGTVWLASETVQAERGVSL